MHSKSRREIQAEDRAKPVQPGSRKLESVVNLLNTGADDYLGRPFALGELLARIKALVRRGQRSRYADFGGVRFGIEYSLRDSPLKAL